MISIACNNCDDFRRTIGGLRTSLISKDREAVKKAMPYNPIPGYYSATASERENRNPDIAEAMVDKELVLCKNSQTHDRV